MTTHILPHSTPTDNQSLADGCVAVPMPLPRGVICRECALYLASFYDPADDWAPGPAVFIHPLGCLCWTCSLEPGWVQALIEDADEGLKRSSAFQGRFASALMAQCVPRAMANRIADEILPLSPGLVAWAKRRLEVSHG